MYFSVIRNIKKYLKNTFWINNNNKFVYTYNIHLHWLLYVHSHYIIYCTTVQHLMNTTVNFLYFKLLKSIINLFIFMFSVCSPSGKPNLKSSYVTYVTIVFAIFNSYRGEKYQLTNSWNTFKYFNYCYSFERFILLIKF